MKKSIHLVLSCIDDIFLSLCVTFSSLSLAFIIIKKGQLSSFFFKICFLILLLWFISRVVKLLFYKRFKNFIKKPLSLLFLASVFLAVATLLINFFRYRFPVSTSTLSFFLLYLSFNIVLLLSVSGNFSKRIIAYCVILSFALSALSGLSFVLGIARTWSGLKSGAGLTLNFSNPNLTGIFLIVIIFVDLFGIFIFRNIVFKVISILFAIFCFFLLILTSARTPFIAVGLAILFLIITLMASRFKKASISTLIAVGLPILFSSLYIIIIILLTPDGIISDAGDGKSAFSRFDIWIEGLSFIGRDMDNFLIGDYAHSMGNGHNSLITVWQQYGFFTTIAEIMFVWQVFTHLFNSSKFTSKSQGTGFIFLLMIWFIGLFEASPIMSSNGMFAFVGLAVVLSKHPIRRCLLMEQDRFVEPNKTLKVLLISNVYARGSIGNIVREIHLNNFKNGLNSYVVYGRGEQNFEDKNVVSIENLLEVYLTKKLRKIFKNQYYGNFFMTREIIYTIKAIKPDAIHIHAINDNYVNFKTLFSFLTKLTGTKIIYTHHSEYMYNGLCGAHTNECNQFICEHCSKCDIYDKEAAKKMFRIKKELIEKFSDSNFLTTSVSPWLHNRVIKSEIFKKFPDITILNGSDIYKYVSENCKKSNYVLYVSPSIDNGQKRYDDLLKIANLNKDVNFVVLTLRQSRKYKDTENIKIVSGITDKKELSKYYSAARLTILTGTRETFSMPVIESLLCGTPVVGYMCGGPESLNITKFASFVENGNLQLLSDELKRFLHSAYNFSDIRDYATKHFSSESMCYEYLKLYSPSSIYFEIDI